MDLKKGVIEFDEMACLDDDANASPWASSGARPVDSHTTLVAVLPNSPMAVLRHHRGNFEGVYPRPLVLREVRRLLKQRSWSSAFDICRRMKVDLNLIVDYDYNSFLEVRVCDERKARGGARSERREERSDEDCDRRKERSLSLLVTFTTRYARHLYLRDMAQRHEQLLSRLASLVAVAFSSLTLF